MVLQARKSLNQITAEVKRWKTILPEPIGDYTLTSESYNEPLVPPLT